MTSFAAKFVAKKLFKETSANKGGYEVSDTTLRSLIDFLANDFQDPYFESVPATRMGFKTKKKVSRALPPGLTKEEEKALTKAKRRAYKVDMALGSFLGMKIGYGAIIGLVPGFGDVADLLLALMVYRTICSVGDLDSGVKMRMQMNIVIDFVIGIIPFVGDIADAAYKCNTKNVVLFEKELRKRGEKRLKGTPQANQEDWSVADEWDYADEEQRMNAQNGPPPGYSSRRDSRRDRGGRDDRRSHRQSQRQSQRQDYDLEAGQGMTQPQPARMR